jgi:hypothetical protein
MVRCRSTVYSTAVMGVAGESERLDLVERVVECERFESVDEKVSVGVAAECERLSRAEEAECA